MIIFLAASATLFELPAHYQGHWTTNLSACSGEDTDGVVIGPMTVTFYEANGVVKSTSQGSKGASATVEFTGEGRSWTEAIRLRPLPGKRLQLRALGKTETYTLCPASDIGS